MAEEQEEDNKEYEIDNEEYEIENKEFAIGYLERKGKIRKMPSPEPEPEQEQEQEVPLALTKEEENFYTKKEKEEITKVIKHGKIYGDPLVILD